jgi:hypothetical protein
MRLRTVFLAIATTLVAAAPAHAATVSLNTQYHYLTVVGDDAGDALSVTAGPAPGSLLVTDRGGRLYASGNACKAQDAASALCSGGIAGVYLAGGAGDDHLMLGVATPFPSYLVGSDGNDVIVDGPGTDVLFGGNGDDTLVARDAGADRLICGAGNDHGVADTADVAAPDCEVVDRPVAPVTPGPAAPAATIPAAVPPAPVRISAKPVRLSTRGVIRVKLGCPRTERRACSGRVTLRFSSAGTARAASASNPIIARGSFKVRPGSSRQVRLKLSRNGRRRIIRRRKARCSVVARSTRGATTRVRAQDVVVLAPRKRSSK